MPPTADGFPGEVRTDSGCAKANQTGEMVGTPTLSGIDNDRSPRAQPLACQVMMHRTDGDERGNIGNFVG
jgi:hypothetical protein